LSRLDLEVFFFGTATAAEYSHKPFAKA